MHSPMDKCIRDHEGFNFLTVCNNKQNTGHYSAAIGLGLEEIEGLI